MGLSHEGLLSPNHNDGGSGHHIYTVRGNRLPVAARRLGTRLIAITAQRQLLNNPVEWMRCSDMYVFAARLVIRQENGHATWHPFASRDLMQDLAASALHYRQQQRIECDTV